MQVCLLVEMEVTITTRNILVQSVVTELDVRLRSGVKENSEICLVLCIGV